MKAPRSGWFGSDLGGLELDHSMSRVRRSGFWFGCGCDCDCEGE